MRLYLVRLGLIAVVALVALRTAVPADLRLEASSLVAGKTTAMARLADRMAAPVADLLEPVMPDSAAGWQKVGREPVFGGEYGTVFDVSVLREDGLYRMWF